MGKKVKRPTWFKLWLNQKPLIDAVPDEFVGKAVKAAYQYFDTGEVQNLDQLSGAVFAVLKSQVDKAIEDYNISVESGRAGAQERWGKGSENNDSPPIASPPNPKGRHTEDRREKKEDNISCSFAVQLLNDLSGSRFRDTTKSTQKLIHAWESEGYTQDDIEVVIRHQCNLWGQDKKMQKYLRPETLFGNKFESYLSDARRNELKQEPGYTIAPTEDPWETAMREGVYV